MHPLWNGAARGDTATARYPIGHGSSKWLSNGSKETLHDFFQDWLHRLIKPWFPCSPNPLFIARVKSE